MNKTVNKKKEILSTIVSLFLTVVIIFVGAASILLARILLPDHKSTTASVKMPEGGGLLFAQQSTDILLSYPWNSISESTSYISDPAPKWLSDSKDAFKKCFSADTFPSTSKEASYAVIDGMYYLKATDSDESVGYSRTFDTAFLEDGRLISFNIEVPYATASSKDINTVYETVGKSAFNNQSTHDILVKYLDGVTRGVPVPDEEYVYNDKAGRFEITDTEGLPFSETDPVSDFFKRYCSYCSQNGVSNKDAQQIYTLLKYGTYACVYSDSKIYLIYSISDFGTLTLVWDVSSTSLCAMTVDARNANPQKEQ